MTDRDNEIKPGEAQQALDAIKEAERAGLSRTIPPRWFGPVLALSVGALLAMTAAGTTELIVFPLIAIGGAITYRSRKAGAQPAETPTGAKGIFALIALAVFGLSLIAGLRVLREMYGITWAPLAGGAVMAIVIYILSIYERRAHIAKIDTDPSE